MNIQHAIKQYFRHAWAGASRQELVFVTIAIILIVLVAMIPTGYERSGDVSVRAKAEVLETFDGGVKNYGVLLQGEQIARVRVLDGPYGGLEAEANNLLYGKADMDKIFQPGDKALVVIHPDADNRPADISIMDHWRVDIQAGMVLGFLFLLLFFGGWTGFKSFVAFMLTGVVIWKLLIPAFLAGIPPVLASLAVVGLLSFFIIFLVAGFSRTGLAAFLGSMSGTAISAIIALALAWPYRLNGAVRPFSETLRFGGFEHLNLTQIFLAGTFLASSGAFMDLAMDVAASIEEIHHKRPGLGFLALVKSGFNVGRKVIGTMSTTLLLAYTGGFTSLLMVFMAQGVPALNTFNMVYVSSEIFHTMTGSAGLVLIAPLTAILASALAVLPWTDRSSRKTGGKSD
ncbi:MAG: YibE/F family protein [Clostridia bacterium]|jgi:uncharacterized membrane protein|nr:YibE/F family protein [Spirochaetia bacterium]